jgi:mevalonate kinase
MKAARVCVLGFLLAGLLAGTAILAQEPPTAPALPKDVATFTQPPGGAFAFFVGDLHGYHQLQAQAAELAQQLVKAEKEETKKEIHKKLTDNLNQQFDLQTQQQQKELDELEKQIAKLKSVLKKRQEAKSAIVDRRLETMIQEAEGLGWTAPGSPMFGYSSPRPMAVPGRHEPRLVAPAPK